MMRCEKLLLLLPLSLAAVACSTDEPVAGAEVHYTEERVPCANRDPYRNLYFGDLHVHTARSWDAYGYYLTVTPVEAYRFARGEGPVHLPPLDEDGVGTREVRIGRPLDFAAVTDHAEYFGETHLCTTPGSSSYDTEACEAFRARGEYAVAGWGMQLVPEDPARLAEICGSDGTRCTGAARDVWAELVAAADAAYDRTASCTFTAFPGYEYTRSPQITNQHRNVLFRTSSVPELPVSGFEEPGPWGLWATLKSRCKEGTPGCDVVVIPHNMNWSNGTMFHPDFEPGLEVTGSIAEAAALRAEMEPIMETFQHKGDMECENGVSGAERSHDPACAFEKLRPPPIEDCGAETGFGGVKDQGCVSRYDFVRGILLQGLREQRGALGMNPYRLGVIGSTDTHNGTPGNTWEEGWPGHVGTADDTPKERLGEGNTTHRGRINNPGGLMAAWAVELSRDAIFEAIRRREVYATSGTRIALRLFGGWELPEDLCESDALVQTGYRRGVPMGGELAPSPSDSAAPVFVVQARHDPGPPGRTGVLLQRVQIIKGWIDADGIAREAVFDVAGDAAGSSSVDEETCEPSGGGHERLCAVWRDPEFDPEHPAFYYARVLENPTCRWSTRACNALPPDQRPEGCADPDIQRTIQERAWSSAIWFTP
jgi:hypothetical protein